MPSRQRKRERRNPEARKRGKRRTRGLVFQVPCPSRSVDSFVHIPLQRQHRIKPPTFVRRFFPPSSPHTKKERESRLLFSNRQLILFLQPLIISIRIRIPLSSTSNTYTSGPDNSTHILPTPTPTATRTPTSM